MYQAEYIQNNQGLKTQLGKLNSTLLKTFQRRLIKVEQIREEELRRVNQLATLGELSAGLTHEIITPLANIKYNLSILRDQTKEQNSITTEIHTALNGLEHIDTILHSYLNQLSDKKAHTTFSIYKQALKAVKVLEFKTRRTHSQIILNVDKNITIKGSSFKFEQVLINLLSNAIDAYKTIDKEESFKIIEIKGKSTLKNIELQVIDFGSGIDKSIKDKIFQTYYTTKPYGKGTGLGLPISKTIIEKDFKGKLELASLKNPTIFKITVPNNCK